MRWQRRQQQRRQQQQRAGGISQETGLALSGLVVCLVLCLVLVADATPDAARAAVRAGALVLLFGLAVWLLLHARRPPPDAPGPPDAGAAAQPAPPQAEPDEPPRGLRFPRTGAG